MHLMQANLDNENMLALIEVFEDSFEKKIDCSIGYEVLPLLIEALYKAADLKDVGVSH